MIQFLRKYLYDRFEKNWFCIGFLLKLLLLWCIVAVDKTGFFLNGGIAKQAADYWEQLGTVDNLVDYGTLSQEGHVNGAPYAGRTPGFIFPYIIYRYFTSSFVALQIHTILQIAFTIVAAKCIYELVLEYTRNKPAAFISFFIVSLLNYIAWIDFEACPESFSNSSYLVSMYLFNRYLTGRKLKHLLFSGALIGWCFYLRGFTIGYSVVFIAALGYMHLVKDRSFGTFIRTCFVFFLPFLVFVSAWTVRNYRQFHEFIPLQNLFIPGKTYETNYEYKNPAKPSILKIRKLVGDWGGDCLWTYAGTPMYWMIRESGAAGHEFSERIFCEGFTEDSMKVLHRLVQLSFNDSLTLQQHLVVEDQIIATTERYRQAFKAGHPMIKALSPYLRMRNFFNKNVVADWPIAKGNLIYYYKVLPLLIYYLMVIIAFAGLLWLLVKKKMNLLTAMFAGQLGIMLIEFGFIVDVIHYRYFATGYLAMVFIAFYAVCTYLQQDKVTPGTLKEEH